MQNTNAVRRTKELAYIVMFSAIMAVCSWISIPGPVPFTLQTFAVFAACSMLGGRRGLVSIIVYILLGMVGLPVFAGFSGGIGTLAGSTGGYIVGFIFIGLTMWIFEKLFGTKWWIKVLAMVLGLMICYTFGTVWFIKVYTQTKGAVTVKTALMWCVIPFIGIDLAKMALAVIIDMRVSKYMHLEPVKGGTIIAKIKAKKNEKTANDEEILAENIIVNNAVESSQTACENANAAVENCNANAVAETCNAHAEKVTNEKENSVDAIQNFDGDSVELKDSITDDTYSKDNENKAKPE